MEGLEEESFINLVNFYSKELIEIMANGGSEDLSRNELKKLSRKNVVFWDYGKLKWFLTAKARNTLLSILKRDVSTYFSK